MWVCFQTFTTANFSMFYGAHMMSLEVTFVICLETEWQTV